MVFHYEWIARRSSYKTGLSGHPNERFEEVVVTDLDVSWSISSCASAEQNVLPRSFQEVAGYFKRTVLSLTGSSASNLRVGATTGHRCAMEIIGIRVNQCTIRDSIQAEPRCRIILRGAMQPDSVQDDVICSRLYADQLVIDAYARRASNLQPQKPVMVSARGKYDRPGGVGLGIGDLSQNVLYSRAVQGWSA